MKSDISTERPEWLTEEKIAEYRRAVAECENPYTKEEIIALPFDGKRDEKRYYAHIAVETLTKYGLM